TAANSGPRWLIMGRLAERTTRAGSGVGPGTRGCGSPMRRSLPTAGMDAARDRRRALGASPFSAPPRRSGRLDATAEEHLRLDQPAVAHGDVLGVAVALARRQLIL